MMRFWTGLLFLAVMGAANATTQLALFGEGLDAIAAGDQQRFDSIRETLGDAFPLIGYLDYAELEARLPKVSPAQVREFRETYRDLPLAGRIYPQALDAYARAGEWQQFLALLDGKPQSLTYRCYHALALEHTGQHDAASAETRQLVSTSQALTPACRQLMTLMQKQQVLRDQDIVLLMTTAFKQDETHWLDTLAKWLPDQRAEKTLMPQLYRAPETLTDLPTGAAYHELYALALWKLARQNPGFALQQWQSKQSNTMLSATTRQSLGSRIAWYSSISSEQPNRVWLDRWLDDHAASLPQTLEQRTRHAIREQDWKAVLHWIARLPSSEQQTSQWQYWKGRALGATGQSQAASQSYGAIAGERNFYGFLAADRLQHGYQLNEGESPSAQLHLDLAQTNALARVRLLLLADRAKDAQAEWVKLLSQVSADNRFALGRYAEMKGWHNFAIVTAIETRQWDQLQWRFPLAWQDKFEQAADKVMPGSSFLMMAIARRESSFFSHAMSPAGARGLMQLMPATAKSMARKQNQTIALDDLFDADTNMQLGTHYLAELLDQYVGNKPLALAAYNAGPHRVSRWLRDQDTPFDVWVETIPFKETRDYVKAVLSYRVIFMKRAGVADDQIALLDENEKQFSYTQAGLKQAEVLSMTKKQSN